MQRFGLRFLSILPLIALPAITSAQITGPGAPNTVPLWQDTVAPGTALGNSPRSGDPNSRVLSIAGAFQNPVSMLLYHASFRGAVKNLVGANSRVAPFDGFVELQTDSNAFNALVDLTSNPILNPFNPDVLVGLNVPGAFLSLRLKPLLGPANPGQPAYFVAGQAGTSISDGFGFKTLGGANCGGGVKGGALKGVTILSGKETVVDLAATACASKPPVDLLAVRSAASVQFYVDGVLKGASTRNLPSSSFTIYDLRLTNSPTVMGGQTWWVSFLTVGIPMF